MASEQFTRFKQLIAAPGLPALGPEMRKGVATERELSRRLDAFFEETKMGPRDASLLRSAALLWNDHLDASHAISQGIEDREGSWLHGIMHRREPDYGNAKYWFHRVGRHVAFSALAERVGALVPDEELAGRLVPEGEWQPFVFVDECEQAEQGNDGARDGGLRQIQAAEFDVLLEHIFQARE